MSLTHESDRLLHPHLYQHVTTMSINISNLSRGQAAGDMFPRFPHLRQTAAPARHQPTLRARIPTWAAAPKALQTHCPRDRKNLLLARACRSVWIATSLGPRHRKSMKTPAMRSIVVRAVVTPCAFQSHK